MSRWWCADCAEGVDARDVTFRETHDERAGGCGGKVVPCVPAQDGEKDDKTAGPTVRPMDRAALSDRCPGCELERCGEALYYADGRFAGCSNVVAPAQDGEERLRPPSVAEIEAVAKAWYNHRYIHFNWDADGGKHDLQRKVEFRRAARAAIMALDEYRLRGFVDRDEAAQPVSDTQERCCEHREASGDSFGSVWRCVLDAGHDGDHKHLWRVEVAK